MEEFITAIHHKTVEMKHAIVQENFESFLALLDERNQLMNEADSVKARLPDYKYTARDTHLLREILLLDQEISPLLEQQMDRIQTQLQQHKKNKLVSKKYMPYVKQTNGAFIDSKK